MKLADHPLPPRRAKSQSPIRGITALVKMKSKSKPAARKYIDQEEINRVAIAIYQQEFRGIKAFDYKPRENTVMHNIWKSEKLELRQQRAWKQFVADLHEAAGESGKVTGSYEQAVEVSGNKTWSSYTNREYDRVTRLCDEFLDRRERQLLVSLIYDETQNTGVLQLERIGLHRNGYRDSSQARAAGIANICYIMDRIATFYGF